MSEPAFATGRMLIGVLDFLLDELPLSHATRGNVLIMSHINLDATFIIELLKIPYSCYEQGD